MNIVVVTDFAQINGGASKVALGSARALALRGHRVLVLAGVGPVDSSLEHVKGLAVECLGQHDLLGNPNRLSAAMQGIWNREAATRMKEILHELPFGRHRRTRPHVGQITLLQRCSCRLGSWLPNSFDLARLSYRVPDRYPLSSPHAIDLHS